MKDGKLKPTKDKLMKKCSDWNENTCGMQQKKF
jgi:hypothetical protein